MLKSLRRACVLLISQNNKPENRKSWNLKSKTLRMFYFFGDKWILSSGCVTWRWANVGSTRTYYMQELSLFIDVSEISRSTAEGLENPLPDWSGSCPKGYFLALLLLDGKLISRFIWFNLIQSYSMHHLLDSRFKCWACEFLSHRTDVVGRISRTVTAPDSWWKLKWKDQDTSRPGLSQDWVVEDALGETRSNVQSWSEGQVQRQSLTVRNFQT